MNLFVVALLLVPTGSLFCGLCTQQDCRSAERMADGSMELHSAETGHHAEMASSGDEGSMAGAHCDASPAAMSAPDLPVADAPAPVNCLDSVDTVTDPACLSRLAELPALAVDDLQSSRLGASWTPSHPAADAPAGTLESEARQRPRWSRARWNEPTELAQRPSQEELSVFLI